MTETPTRCPMCGGIGAVVARVTLKALLTPDGLRRGVPEEPRYCGAAECPVVYFDADASVTFTEADLIVPVYAKHTGEASVPVCYCFGVTAGEMRDADRASELREMVAAQVRAAHCACEVKNPSGRCCLGDLVRLERGAAQAMPSCCATT